jgi:hypothetical protein
MRSVHDHGTPLVDDAARLEGVAALGHRGRKRDPLYRIRKLLLTAQE